MKNRITLPLVVLLAGILTSCSTPEISTHEIVRSDPRAVALVAASQRAQGGDAFRQIRDISVHYDGKWGLIGPRFQPVLVDKKFRGSSEERLVLKPRLVIAQEHSGASGRKVVVRENGNVTVVYNGSLSSDVEARRAAALVADAYTLFLLGPHYFQRAGVVLETEGETQVDKAVCDQALAVLRPGFGMAEEDRVLLSIDRATHQLRRVRMTLNGLESTLGAEVDVTFRDYRTIGGVLWPTDFDERIRVPFDLHAHHWTLLGLDLNRGFTTADLTASGFKSRAAKLASPLPDKFKTNVTHPPAKTGLNPVSLRMRAISSRL